MKLLRNIPISRKVLLLALLVSSVGLLLTGGALFAFQVYTFRAHFPRELAADGSIIASHSVGPLALKDPAAATEMLGALRAKPHISEAQLRLPDGSLFARSGRDQLWTPSTAEGLHHSGPHLVYAEPLILDMETIGVLFLRADYRAELFSLLRVYALVLGVVLTLSIGLTTLLSARLQRVISAPILSLAQTAKEIASQRDYSLRARKLEDDEIGEFTDAFNEMLTEIQDRDTALDLSREKLETLINTIEGIVWEADPETLRFSFVSAQALRLSGRSAADWMKEPAFWKTYLHPDDRDRVLGSLHKAIAAREPSAQEFRLQVPDRPLIWVRSYANIIMEGGKPALVRGVLLDVTREKQAAEELAALHAELLEISRFAGMAEVATGVLHNVGNVLNSVNVSVTIACDRIRKSEVGTLPQLSCLLKEHEHDLGSFLTLDERGRHVPAFIHELALQVQDEHAETVRELALVAKHVEHIKEIVAMQQNYARVSGVIEALDAAELVDDALQISAEGFQRHRVTLVKAFEDVPLVAVDRHKVLQILINLLHNAKHAVEENPDSERRITLRIRPSGPAEIAISVEDTGVGIPPENLTKIFSHGFTTKKDGHGFGLHSGANAAKQMGGTLIAHSVGMGRGAIFTLNLPIATPTSP